MLRTTIRFCSAARLYTHGTADSGRRWAAVLQVDNLPLRTVVGTWTSYDLDHASLYQRNVMGVAHALYALSNSVVLPKRSELIILNNDRWLVGDGNSGWRVGDASMFRWIKQLQAHHQDLHWGEVAMHYEELPGHEMRALFGQLEKFAFNKTRF